MAQFWHRHQFPILCCVLQVAFLLIFAFFAEYKHSAQPDTTQNGTLERKEDRFTVDNSYAMFQDVHVMIFVGFGYLMTFLKRYGYSSVGINFMLSSFTIQWVMAFRGIFKMITKGTSSFQISMFEMLVGDFNTATILISMGVTLGKLTPSQYIVMAFFEVIASVINEHYVFHALQVNDVGGSMVVHVFGAYFGLGIAKVLHRGDVNDNKQNEGSYHSDIFAMIGTLFLWVFWPSFNSVAASPADAKYRAIMNTLLSLCACCLTTVMVTWVVKKGRLAMDCIQNATLAGGVAVGTAANLMLQPAGALAVGICAALVSVLGFHFFTPFIATKLKTHDTCGVNNLHGMPGLLAGIVGAIATLFAKEATYGQSLYTIFEAMDPSGLNRTAGSQCLFQLAALGMCFAVALVTGLITGLILKLPIWSQVRTEALFMDIDWWEVDDDAMTDFTTAIIESDRSSPISHKENSFAHMLDEVKDSRKNSH